MIRASSLTCLTKTLLLKRLEATTTLGCSSVLELKEGIDFKLYCLIKSLSESLRSVHLFLYFLLCVLYSSKLNWYLKKSSILKPDPLIKSSTSLGNAVPPDSKNLSNIISNLSG